MLLPLVALSEDDGSMKLVDPLASRSYVRSIPTGFRVSARFDSSRLIVETGTSWAVPAAEEPAFYFCELVPRAILLVFLLVSTAICG